MPSNDASADGGDLGPLTEILGHAFKDPELLQRAVTHRSVSHTIGRQGHYERLEFLGDRVLGLVVADLLFHHFAKEAEGALARRHTALVRRETLAEVAEEIGLGRYLRLARSEDDSGERENPAILANACEAVIAALYIDGGLPVAQTFIQRHWADKLRRDTRPPSDNKTNLQEWAQARALALPSYREVVRSGPSHDPHFTVEVQLEGQAPARGEGRSKRLAEQEAAGRLLALVTEGTPA